ncbi:MAG: hypothetical protein ACI88L_000703 [Candidatus Paceibacteria bacterium]|jgi:hypothetical protein
MKKISIALTSLFAAFAPAFAFAQSNQGLVSILDSNIAPLLNAIIPILITVGVIYFIWGIVQYVIADDEKAKEAGKNRMLWGLIGLFVIVTFWGLITVIGNTLGIDAGVPPVIEINPFP